MQQHRFFSSVGARGLVATGMACALGMVSCKDKGAEEWNQQQAAQAKAPVETAAPVKAAAETPSAEAAEQKELLNYMIFNVGKLAGEQTTNPIWYAQVRDMRNKLEEYYNSIEARGNDPKMSMQLGLLLADITRSMRAYDKALKLYADTLSKWESQPEAERKTLEARRMRSSIANGTGSCYLVQRKAVEALPYYEQALEIDEAIFQELAPADDAPLPAGNAPISPDLERAVEDVLSSYRCLAECQRWADDPEEARDTFKKGQALAMRMNNLRPGASLQFIQMLSAQGDLENSCGQLQNAYMAWARALQLTQGLEKLGSTPPALMVKVKQDQRKLVESLKAIAPKVRAEQEANRGEEADDMPAPAADGAQTPAE